MVDLQRRIHVIGSIDRARKQDGRENSNVPASAKSVSGEKFSGADSAENFIRGDLS
jgi:hypothetical protein